MAQNSSEAFLELHEQEPLTHCPECKRKLLTTRSILCNWCGMRIDDPAYLQRAAEERAALDEKLRDKLERENQETARHGIIGRLKQAGKSGQPRETILMPPPGFEK